MLRCIFQLLLMKILFHQEVSFSLSLSLARSLSSCRVLGWHCQRFLLEDQTHGSVPRLQLRRDQRRNIRQVYGGSVHQHLLQRPRPQRPREETGRQSGLLLVSVCVCVFPVVECWHEAFVVDLKWVCVRVFSLFHLVCVCLRVQGRLLQTWLDEGAGVLSFLSVAPDRLVLDSLKVFSSFSLPPFNQMKQTVRLIVYGETRQRRQNKN